MFSLNPQKINFEDVIDEGEFGSLHPYLSKGQQDDRWVVRFIYAQNFEKVIELMQEIVLGSSCDHPSVVPVRGYYIEKTQPKGWNIYIKYPKMQESLQKRIEKRRLENKPFSEEEIVKLFYSLLCGLEYLHEKKIAHMDINPKSILIDKEGKARLADIGRKVVQNADSSLIAKGSETSNPDHKLSKKNLYTADAWSLGMTMIELCLLKSSSIQASGSNDEKEAAIKDLLSQLESRYPKTIVMAIEGLVECNIEQRMKVGQVKKMLEESYAELLGINQSAQKKMIVDEPVMINPQIYTNQQMQALAKLQEMKLKRLAQQEERKIEETDPAIVKFSQTIKELDDKWNEVFRLTTNAARKEVKIVGNYRWANNDKVQEFMTDFNAKIRENQIEDLRHLSIRLGSCSQINTDGFKSLASGLSQNFRNLQSLEINTSHTKSLTSSGVKELADGIFTNLPNLQSVTLDFSHCDIYNEGVKALSSQIGLHQKSLVQLNLDFTWSQKYTDEAVFRITNDIFANCKSLKSLSLKLSGKMSSKAIKDCVHSIVNNLKHLQDLTLEFSPCKQMALEEHTELKKLLEYIPLRKIRF